MVNSDEHCVRILVVPDVALSAVEVPISCEACLRLVQERNDSRCSVAKTTGQIEHDVRSRWAPVVLSGGIVHGGFVFARLAALKTDLNPWHGQWHVC